MRVDRQEYIAYMTGEAVKRPLFSELFGPLVGLPEEWKAQGASPEELSLTAFGFDYVPVCPVGHTGQLNPPEPVLLHEDAETKLYRDALGRTCRLIKASSTIPLPLDYPVKDWDSWLKIKPAFGFDESRVDGAQIEKALALAKQGALVLAGMPGGFDFPRELMGDGAACLCYYDEPELMRDMIDTVCDTAYRVLDRVSDRVAIDNLMVHEDMAGKSGPLIGPGLVAEFIAPYYRKVIGMLKSKGTRLFAQDSDGDMRPVMDVFAEAGVNVFYPMEPAAGMDTVAARKKYGPAVAYKGGVDKHVLRQGRAAIRKELEYKMQPCMREGGMLFALDHRIPNGTPLEDYRYYVRTARELLGLPAKPEPGWARMAF